MYHCPPLRWSIGEDLTSPVYDPSTTQLPPPFLRLRRLELGGILSWNEVLPTFLLLGVLSFPGLETMGLDLTSYPNPGRTTAATILPKSLLFVRGESDCSSCVGNSFW